MTQAPFHLREDLPQGHGCKWKGVASQSLSQSVMVGLFRLVIAASALLPWRKCQRRPPVDSSNTTLTTSSCAAFHCSMALMLRVRQTGTKRVGQGDGETSRQKGSRAHVDRRT